MRELGVTSVLGPVRRRARCSPTSSPGDFVVCDQLVDRTWGRPDTFFDGPGRSTTCRSPTPTAPSSAPIAVAAGRAEGITVHDGGTVVVIQGPRFSTRAESRWYGSHGLGGHQHDPVSRGRPRPRAGLCYAAIALITDYDAGVEGIGRRPVTQEEVFAFFEANVDKVREVLLGRSGRRSRHLRVAGRRRGPNGTDCPPVASIGLQPAGGGVPRSGRARRPSRSLPEKVRRRGRRRLHPDVGCRPHRRAAASPAAVRDWLLVAAGARRGWPRGVGHVVGRARVRRVRGGAGPRSRRSPTRRRPRRGTARRRAPPGPVAQVRWCPTRRSVAAPAGRRGTGELDGPERADQPPRATTRCRPTAADQRTDR